MPAATIVFRPRAVRVAAYVTAVIVLAGTVLFAVVMPGWLLGGRIGLVAVGVLAALFCHLEASVRLIARPGRLEVRNLFRARDLEWSEIVGVSFPMGEPWAHLDLADGTTQDLHALQRYDGRRAVAAAHRLKDLIAERGEAREP